jgi:quercetin dioxygenase-like cupin family protein
MDTFKCVSEQRVLIITCLLILLIQGCKKINTLPDPLDAGWKGEPVCEVLKNNDELRVLKCVFDPGVGHEKHYHNPHFGYTLRGGQFRITDAQGTREVKIPDGYSFSNDSIIRHEVLNIGDTRAEFLIIEYK